MATRPERNRGFAPIVMAGEGRPSTSCDARTKEDVDGGAKPRHDDGAKVAVSCSERSDPRAKPGGMRAIPIAVHNGWRLLPPAFARPSTGSQWQEDPHAFTRLLYG
jgi:hypothetical protein